MAVAYKLQLCGIEKCEQLSKPNTELKMFSVQCAELTIVALLSFLPMFYICWGCMYGFKYRVFSLLFPSSNETPASHCRSRPWLVSAVFLCPSVWIVLVSLGPCWFMVLACLGFFVVVVFLLFIWLALPYRKILIGFFLLTNSVNSHFWVPL